MKKAKIVFFLISISLLFTRCSEMKVPIASKVKQVNDNSKIAAYPLNRYSVNPTMFTGYFTTEQSIVLTWALTPSGCPDFLRYKVYLDNSLIATISYIDEDNYVLGQKPIGRYSWNVWAYWSIFYSDDFGVASLFAVEIDPNIKGPNPVGGTGHSWYIDTYAGGSFEWTVANSSGQIIYSTTNATGSISDSNWPPHPSGSYHIECVVTCANSNNVYTVNRTITVIN